MPADLSLRSLLFVSSGFITWAVHFTAIYTYAATVCALEPASAGERLRPSILSMTMLAIAAELFIIGQTLPAWESGASGSSSDIFIGRLATAIAAVATVVMVWETLPVLFLSSCQ